MPNYIYHKLAAITIPWMPTYIYGIVVSVKEPSRYSNGREKVRVDLIDETAYSIEDPFHLTIFCCMGEVPPKIEKYQVIRAHRMKVEPFNGKLDGRVFKSSDIVTISYDVTNKESICTTAKTFEWTDNDTARVRELYNWMWNQAWYKSHVKSNMTLCRIEDINEEGTIKLYCKIVGIRKSRDGECIVLTVYDGTVSSFYIKKIHDVEYEQKHCSDGSAFVCNQSEVDIVINQVTDKFNQLKVGNFVCIIGVEVNMVPTKSTDDRLMLSLTLSAVHGSFYKIKPDEAAAKQIERDPSYLNTSAREKLERLLSNRNIISSPDITNSSVVDLDYSDSFSSVEIPTVQLTSPSKKIRTEGDEQFNVGCINKKLPTNDVQESSLKTAACNVNVGKICQEMAVTSLSTISSTNKYTQGKKLINPEKSSVSHSGGKKPYLAFSIGNSDKALKSLKKKICESASNKHQTSSLDNNITTKQTINKPRQHLNSDDFFDEVEDVCASHDIYSPTKDLNVGDTVEKELRAMFGESDATVTPEKSISRIDSRSPEKLLATSKQPLNNAQSPSSSEDSLSVGTFTQFHSKLQKHTTSTQITLPQDSGKEDQLSPAKCTDKLQENVGQKSEERHVDNITVSRKRKHNSVARTSALSAQQPCDEQDECSQESQNMYSTYNSHPHYDTGICPTVQDNVAPNSPSSIKANPRKERKIIQAAQKELESPNAIETSPKNVCVDISSSTKSLNDVINEFHSDMHEAVASDRNSQSWCREESRCCTTECGALAHDNQLPFQREAVSSKGKIRILKTGLNDQREFIPQSHSKSPTNVLTMERDTQTSICVAEDNLHVRESSTVNSLVSHDQTLSQESGIPCYQVPHHSSVENMSCIQTSGLNSEGSGLSKEYIEEQQRISSSSLKIDSLRKTWNANVCKLHNGRNRFNNVSLASFENNHRADNSKSLQSSTGHNNSRCHKNANAGCTCVHYMDVSYAITTVIVDGWLVDIEPSLSGHKEDLVSGYCMLCNRLKRLSLVKKFVSAKGDGLCSYCHSQGRESELILMFIFTMKLVIKSGRLFKIIVGHNPASKLFDFTLEEYVCSEEVQTKIINYLKKMIVKEKKDRTSTNRVTCSAIYEFDKNQYLLREFLSVPFRIEHIT